MPGSDQNILAAGAERVAVAGGAPGYDSAPPYSPSAHFPEYPFSASTVVTDGAHAYAAVRESLRMLELDAAAFCTARWNPLGGIVRPGDLVVIKPNLVREFRETHPGHGDCLVTHGAVLRAVIDYVHLALRGTGRLVVADAPHSDCDFARVLEIVGLREIQAFYNEHAGFAIEILDLRPEAASKIDGVIVGHHALPGDPAGYAVVDLGPHSCFAEIEDLCDKLYGSEYDTGEIRRHHQNGRHEYLISRTVLSADCVISLPKLKTHKKTGITVNLKNLVGINGNKNWLPHHREGTPAQGGDQFPDDALANRVERTAVNGFRRVFPRLGPLRPLLARPVKALGKWAFGDTNVDRVRSGNWHGNDTTWRMVLDLNRALHFADTDGRLHAQPTRRFFSVVDGIVGGEGNGPLDATPTATGVVLAGFNPVAVDCVAARLMGFDWRGLPMLHQACREHDYPLVRPGAAPAEIHARDAFGPASVLRNRFRPHFGWRDCAARRDLSSTGERCAE